MPKAIEVKIHPKFALSIGFAEDTQKWFYWLMSYDFHETYHEAYDFESPELAEQAGRKWLKQNLGYIKKHYRLPP